MLGLKRGTVELSGHLPLWEESAKKVIAVLREVLGETAIDIQHVGSTAIPSIPAKPIVDLAVAVKNLDDILPFEEALKEKGIIFRGSDQPGQYLFVLGDFKADTRTHHIHVVPRESEAWHNYLNFRDYLRAFPEKAAEYGRLKEILAEKYPADRGRYTSGKQQLIDRLLAEAKSWQEAADLKR